MAPSHSATSSQSPAQAESEELSWEGDRMYVANIYSYLSSFIIFQILFYRFNIYIYDYCFKRGYRETARALVNEADLRNDTLPPINAKQGLLFECVLSF